VCDVFPGGGDPQVPDPLGSPLVVQVLAARGLCFCSDMLLWRFGVRLRFDRFVR
jgi:hypothetical protein